MDLYQKVLKNLDGTEELLSGEFCSKISMMSDPMTTDIYIIMLQHFINNNKGMKESLVSGKEIPYLGKTVTKEGKGVNFKATNVPEDLQKIVYRYMKMVSD